MQKHQKPPRPPPLSVSQPANPPPLSVSQPANPPPLSVSQPSNPPPQPQPNQPPPQPNSRPSPRPNDNESPQSPLRLESPHQSDDHDYTKNSGANVSNEQYFSPLTSPAPQTPPKDSTTPKNFSSSTSASSPHQIVTFQSFHRKEEPPQAHSAVVLGGADTTQQQQEEGNGNGEGERKGRLGRGDKRTTRGGGGGGGVRFGGVKDIVRSSSKEDLIEKINLGVRVYEIVFCLISFSVMASDRTQGWSGDSFDRYKEYRFCLSVNILGFLYAAFQAYDVGNHLVTGKHVITHHLRYQFDFIMDQILAYLLISASSAAASRVDDWQANWGKDEFTAKASASVSMAFLAFLGFAMSSLISGYNLCNRDLT